MQHFGANWHWCDHELTMLTMLYTQNNYVQMRLHVCTAIMVLRTYTYVHTNVAILGFVSRAYRYFQHKNIIFYITYVQQSYFANIKIQCVSMCIMYLIRYRMERKCD